MTPYKNLLFSFTLILSILIQESFVEAFDQKNQKIKIGQKTYTFAFEKTDDKHDDKHEKTDDKHAFDKEAFAFYEFDKKDKMHSFAFYDPKKDQKTEYKQDQKTEYKQDQKTEYKQDQKNNENKKDDKHEVVLDTKNLTSEPITLESQNITSEEEIYMLKGRNAVSAAIKNYTTASKPQSTYMAAFKPQSNAFKPQSKTISTQLDDENDDENGTISSRLEDMNVKIEKLIISNIELKSSNMKLKNSFERLEKKFNVSNIELKCSNMDIKNDFDDCKRQLEGAKYFEKDTTRRIEALEAKIAINKDMHSDDNNRNTN